MDPIVTVTDPPGTARVFFRKDFAAATKGRQS
jgi:hypothetical protein